MNKGEIVLCMHGTLIYKAKVLQCSKNKAGQDVYYVHYVDWNKNWDEWVTGDRILEYNAANLQRQIEAREQYYAAITKGTKKKRQKGLKSSGSGDVNAMSKNEHGDVLNDELPSTSRGCGNAKNESGLVNSEFEKDGLKYEAVTNSYEDSIEKEVPSDEEGLEEEEERNDESSLSNTIPETEEESLTESKVAACVEEYIRSGVKVKIIIPDELKQYLADDWVAINHQHKWSLLPAKMTVQGLINEYDKLKQYVKKRASSEILKYIVDCFNATISEQLLYNCERPQFESVLQQSSTVPPSEIYGSFHLLRLFTKLGSLLEYTVLDKESMEAVEVQIHSFLHFLKEKKSIYFNPSDYQDME